MTNKLWIPGSDDPELIRLYVIFEEYSAKHTVVRLRIAHSESDLSRAEKDLIILSNGINNLKSDKIPIVSLMEFKTIVTSKKFFTKFINAKKKIIKHDILMLADIQKTIDGIQKKINDRKKFTNVIYFRNR